MSRHTWVGVHPARWLLLRFARATMATIPPSTAAEDAALFAWLDQTPEEALE